MFEVIYGATKPLNTYTKIECWEMYAMWLEKARVDMYMAGFVAAIPAQIAAAFWYGQWERR